VSLREPARDWYDATIGLGPKGPAIPVFAYALVKLTYEMRDGQAFPTQAEPLLHDVWNDEELKPPIPCGSDYWYDKPATDVMVRGSAYARGGSPFTSLTVAVKIGNRTKRIAVFGNRVVEWSSGGVPTFSAPSPIDKVPLLYQLAYGGLDSRVPIPEAQVEEYMRLAREGLMYDHPGMYPRNPVGKGYLALPGPVEGLLLPNLEDPSDLLQPDRLTSGAPELWYRQPLPWCFEWSVGLTFPRCLFLDVDAWYPGPDSVELPEVARGFIPPGLKAALAANPSLQMAFFQEASLGMVFPEPLAGQPVEILGMHPEERALTFTVPEAPRLEMTVEGSREAVASRLINFVLAPNEKRFTLTYAAKSRPLPRAFVPGLHKLIPISVSVNGDTPVSYQTPATIRDRLKQAPGGTP
jgi:hypothetical protein